MVFLRWSGCALVWFALLSRSAGAIPVFAHQDGLACQKCHSVIPRLNAFGAAFLEHGDQLPEVVPNRAVLPLAAKVNLVYASDPASGTPKAVVDEIEAFLAGTLGPRTSYFVEQYVLDGGFAGSTREAWVEHRLSAADARVPLYLEGGSFTLPLPVDPETFRETNQHYTLFDQTVGANRFAFFDPKIGAQARVGVSSRGTSAAVVAVQGHDQQSGAVAQGVDLMGELQHAMGPVTLSGYRYTGVRPAGAFADRFWREGVGVVYAARRWESDTVWQTGNDSNADGGFTGVRSSGGFTQLRYEIGPRLFVLARYEGTGDGSAGMTRDFVALAGYRTGRNSRFTVENVTQHVPQTKNSLALQFTAAY